MIGGPATSPPVPWSITRHHVFDRCRRQYFHSYHDPDPETRRLKRLTQLPLWAGSVVHETIEGVLRERDRAPGDAEREALIQSVIHGPLKQAWHESEAGTGDFRLFEHEYQVPVEKEDKTILVGTVRRALRHFFTSDVLAEAYAVGRGAWLNLEELVSCPVEGAELHLRMDLAYRDPRGEVVIVDWKTGVGPGKWSAVQLAAYGLYALHAGWAAAPEEIRTELVCLVKPRTYSARLDAKKVARARGFIRKSAGRMATLLAKGPPRAEAFPRIDQPRVCRRCNFRRLCFPREG